MTTRQRLTDRGVAALKAKRRRYTIPDPECVGLYIVVQKSGAKSFVVVARDPRGKQHYRTVGNPPMSIEDARDNARKVIRSIREAPPDSFEGVAQQWFKLHVKKNGLRSAFEVERFMRQHILGAWPGRDVASIRRKDVAELMDHIEEEHGARQADEALATLRRIFNWRAKRDENFSSPLCVGMKRQKAKETERVRILTDDEIGPFGRRLT